MRLFHFSDDPAIAKFEPRPVRIASDRPKGQEWLNDPLVWAIEETRQSMYLFPRECPRILLWATPKTTEADVALWLEGKASHTLAYIESGWLERLQTAKAIRYELPTAKFSDTHDAGMWVSRKTVYPLDKTHAHGTARETAAAGTELRVVDSLLPLKNGWASTVHASGIRLRNARVGRSREIQAGVGDGRV